MPQLFTLLQRRLKKNLVGSKFIHNINYVLSSYLEFNMKPLNLCIVSNIYSSTTYLISYFKGTRNSCVPICRAKYGVEEMCRDQWNWASTNPWGYRPQP